MHVTFNKKGLDGSDSMSSLSILPRPSDPGILPDASAHDAVEQPVPHNHRPQVLDIHRNPEQESRHEERPDLALPVVVCGVGLNGKLFFELTRTLDVSRSGCRVHLRTKPQVDSPLAMRLIRCGEAMREETIQILCHIVWLRAEADGWTVGAETLGQTML